MRFNPFNPQYPPRSEFFVGRTEEIERFEQILLQTINSSPLNMALTGNRGIGKTSTLGKFEELAGAKNCLVIRSSLVSAYRKRHTLNQQHIAEGACLSR